jgi:acyl-CoA synthetase (AMP-forming)/AMP-acid ligase II
VTTTNGSRPGNYLPITISDGIRTSMGREPDKVAFRENGRELTYRALVERIDRVANGVTHGLDLEPGDRAALLSPNTLEFVEIVCGLAEAGVPPALINSRASTGEVKFICDDAAARVLFVHPSLEELARASAPETVQHVIVIGDAYEQWLASSSPQRTSAKTEEWETFCIPYTAGTTGSPKGVLLPHRSRVLTFFSMAVEYGCYGPDDRALAVAPLYHGAGFAFALAPVFFGGSCEILPRFDPEELLRAVERGRSTNVFMVPSHFQALFALGDEVLDRYDTGSLRTIISNAAPLAQVMKERIVERFGDDLLFECYGSTEGGIVSNLRPADQLRKLQCVGLPFPLTSVRILDEEGAEVGPGTPGELFSSSPYLFSGYWNRPQESLDAIQDGWFSAGDIAYRDEEGYIYLIDRKNDKIISGGVNIFPREIEEVLLRHPLVTEAAVFGIPDERWGEAVHAVVVLAPDANTAEEAIIDFCAESVARYKLPKRIEFAGALPRNAAGKILRRELRDPHWAGLTRGVS